MIDFCFKRILIVSFFLLSPFIGNTQSKSGANTSVTLFQKSDITKKILLKGLEGGHTFVSTDSSLFILFEIPKRNKSDTGIGLTNGSSIRFAIFSEGQEEFDFNLSLPEDSSCISNRIGSIVFRQDSIPQSGTSTIINGINHLVTISGDVQLNDSVELKSNHPPNARIMIRIDYY